MQNEQAFNIQFVANITGINPHTIRAWEKRYQAIEPQRDHNGRRLYNNQDIERLSTLNKLVRMGNSISDISNLSMEELTQIGEQYSDKIIPKKKRLADFDYTKSLENIFLGINFFKLDVINHELSKAANELACVDFALEIVAPLIAKIRGMKQENNLSTEQRKQLYLILKSHLIKAIYQTNIDNNKKQKVLIAGAQGSLNELGSMLATILFLDQGYEVDFLGGNVDETSLGKISAQMKPDILFIGINYSHEDTLPLKAKEKYLETISQFLTMKTKVMIGAYDICFKVPEIDYECFTDFKDIHKKIISEF